MKKFPKVSIIVLNWNGIRDTLPCLNSFKKINYPNYEIVVVDNGSTDNSVSILKKIGGIKLIENRKNLGFAEGNNVGIRHALKEKVDYIFLLNNDTIVHRNLIKELVKEIEKNSRIGIVGPKIYKFNSNIIDFVGGKINYFIGDAKHIGWGHLDQGQFDKVKEVDYITGAAFFVRKNVLEKIGLLDKDFFAFYEELDFCVRAKRAGYKIVYVPKAKLWHKVSASAGKSSPLIIYYNVRNRLIFMKKNAKKIYWITFQIFYLKDFLLLIIYKFCKWDFEAIRSAFKGLRDGLAYSK